MIKLLSLAHLLLGYASAAALAPIEEQVSYDGYKVFRITTGENLANVQEELQKVDVQTWNIDVAQHMDVAIAPTDLSQFEALGLSTSVMHDDLGADIAAEWDETNTKSMNIFRAMFLLLLAFLIVLEVFVMALALWLIISAGFTKRDVPDLSWFSAYHSYDDHIQFIRNLQNLLPRNSEVITSGTSVQGRAITGLHVWGSGGKGNKEAVLIHGTVHAREWITTMVVEYFTYQLTTGYDKDTNTTTLLDSYDFYILPIVNPDGFVYTQTTNRLWRKNRSAAPSGSSCLGTDINRNWSYQWDVPGGSSTNPCDETYRGRSAGDTPENKGLVALIDNLKATTGIKLYLDVHSYGQYILTPYGYSCDAVAANQDKHDTLAKDTGEVIRAFSGTNWTTGPSCSTLYATSGSSTDYVGDIGNAELSLTFELRDEGRYGFVLPSSQILPSSQEMWEGWKYLMLNM